MSMIKAVSYKAFPATESAVPKKMFIVSDMLEHTPQYTTLSLIGRDGYLACGSLTVNGDLFLGDRAYYLLATTHGRFSVGEYAIGRITGKPTVGVAFPIADGSDELGGPEIWRPQRKRTPGPG